MTKRKVTLNLRQNYNTIVNFYSLRIHFTKGNIIKVRVSKKNKPMKKLFIIVLLAIPFVFSQCDSSDEIFTEAGGDAYLTDGSSSGDNGNGSDTIQAGQITAGEWNDLENWDFWKNLQQEQAFNEALRAWKFSPLKRCSFKITDKEGQPAINYQIELFNNGEKVYTARTDNKGKAELWVNLFENANEVEQLTAEISKNGNTETLYQVAFMDDEMNTLQLSFSAPEPKQVDIHFMVDATGSMTDELEFLKVELSDVIQRVKSDQFDLDFRYGAVFYRDEGDAYVTRVSPFTSNKSDLLQFIDQQHAEGGGDFPEAVDQALEMTLLQQSWGKNNRASICFVLLDAPPHETENVIEKIHNYSLLASEKGIKIIPITASGIDKNTEFLMRSMALATNGTYVFVTNHSGIGNEHLEPTIGEYQVEYLNNLLVRLINEYTD